VCAVKVKLSIRTRATFFVADRRDHARAVDVLQERLDLLDRPLQLLDVGWRDVSTLLYVGSDLGSEAGDEVPPGLRGGATVP